MTENPYPKMIDCDSTGQSVGNPLYKVWNEGWAAGFADCMSPRDKDAVIRFIERGGKKEVT